MPSFRTQRRLRQVHARLRAARDELAATEEQARFWADEHAGERDYELSAAHCARLRAEIVRLEALSDQLLDSLPKD